MGKRARSECTTIEYTNSLFNPENREATKNKNQDQKASVKSWGEVQEDIINESLEMRGFKKGV